MHDDDASSGTLPAFLVVDEAANRGRKINGDHRHSSMRRGAIILDRGMRA
jgi:hypothetical protein